MKNTLFLDALSGINFNRPPVWMMRQAGRHLASYRALRSRYSFLEMCHAPDLIAQVTTLPLERYPLDAAILFSDILVVPEAMGMQLRFEDKIGPIFDKPLKTRQDVEALPDIVDPEAFNFVIEGIKQLKTTLNVPLIGFCGAPFTVASYMIEGGSSRDLKKTKRWLLQDPDSFHLLLSKVANWSIVYLKQQIAAGVNALQIFDSWANFLAHHQFIEFSLSYLERIVNELKYSAIPVILFCKGSSVFAPLLASLHPAAIGLDWNCQMSQIRRIIPSSITLQGNLDPDILFAPLSQIKFEVNRLLDEMNNDPAYIFNLGHGIHPDVSEQAVEQLVTCIHKRGLCPVTSSF